MADLIQLLPDHIANQIAAGEVVQRPASVVKELLENAIDAGAKNIRLIIKNAGKTLIQVVDDGIGMSETDARMCFERHATSKIRQTEDLFSIRTKGFRGEAMASIAAVAQVEMRTKKQQEELGIQIKISGSKINSQEPCQTAAGTSIAVKNLFYNIPARRNFLKSDTVEMRHIIDEFQHVALAHPDTFFSLHHNSAKLYHLPISNLRQRIVGILGNKVNKNLIPIEEDTDIIKITGYIGKPEAAKKTRGDQFFFVNNRFIKSGYLNHALLSAYEDLLPEKVYPLYVVFFEINPKKIDVNVHPTKQEIKFEDERLVYNYLRVTARHALAQNSITPSLDFEVESGISQHLDEAHLNPSVLKSSFDRPQNDNQTFKSKVNNTSKSSFSGHQKQPKTETELSNLQNWDKLYENIENEAMEQGQKLEQEEQTLFSSSIGDRPSTQQNESDELTFSSKASAASSKNLSDSATTKHLYQLHNRYIVSPIKSGFLLIDQQMAHQRIMYERYLYQLEHKKATTQKLLFPQSVELSTGDAALLKELLPQLNELGLDIKEFGTNSFVVHGLPSELSQQNEQLIISQLLEQFKQNIDLKIELYDNLARSLAYQASIKAGKSLTAIEMQQLINELFACQVPYVGPNGHKTFISMDMVELSKRFE
ncbi:DNA mismatch repair endonuclease MutL [Aureispira anguillae]|uniref:DNA mismatch repair protein MutL n=1 Tax=Aureispira anguillae TaxID=2864201 RepID=A0A915VKC9_9BACT|nr:DNA mismatch repair endonuclease MutL [Aureispira anguillae]BDS09627.1 DNA mismatch repair endonuclease MutL [Aureispira anguillae]